MGTPDIEDIYLLSPMQEGMVFHTASQPDSRAYFVQVECMLEGDLNTKAFAHAWQRVVDYHHVFRTAFLWRKTRMPLQTVFRRVVVPFVQEDWSHDSAEARTAKREAILCEDRKAGFDISRPPLMRLRLCRLTQDSYHFVWSHHHLLIDGWSIPLVFRDLMNFYCAIIRGKDYRPEPPPPYRNYIAWLRRQNLAEAEIFWRQELSGFRDPTPLPRDEIVSGRAEASAERKTESLQLANDRMETLKRFALEHHLTVNTIVQGAWALLLSLYSGQEDIVFGTTVSGRPSVLAGVESMVGLFINTLPARIKVRPGASLMSWLAEVQSRQAVAREYDYSPLVEIQGWSEVGRSSPLFQSIVVFENYPGEPALPGGIADITIRDVGVRSWPHYPLTLVVNPRRTFVLSLKYDAERFTADTIRRLLAELERVLAEFERNPAQAVGEVQCLSEPERKRILIDWNDSAVDFRINRCLHEEFEIQVELIPHAVAVVYEDNRLTYLELNRRANQLAHYLSELGVGPETLVGLFLEPSVEVLVALLAILKAGGAYVPLDPGHPPQRLAFIIKDTGVHVIVTENKLVGKLGECSATLIRVDVDRKLLNARSERNFPSTGSIRNLAYVIYTSGSTGRPKGTMVEHRQVLNYARAIIFRLGIGPGAAYGMVQPLSVDSSKTMIYPALLSGGCIHIISRERGLDGEALSEYFARQQIDCLKIAPSHLLALLDASSSPERILPCGWLILGGEALRWRWIEKIRSLAPKCAIFNHYGPTETTVGVLTYRIEDCGTNAEDSMVPLGGPLSNVRAYVLNRSECPVPPGAPGELHIGGACVARGYLNLPEQTQERFVADPFDPERKSKLYRTGDLVRRKVDGNIEFLGRIDHQIKIRGHRIEPGEVESALHRYPGLKEVLVTAHQGKQGADRLVGYVVSQGGTQLSGDQLRHYLVDKLPGYMIPETFVLLDALPRTLHGKIDLIALPPPHRGPEAEKELTPPRNSMEESLIQIWSRILEQKDIGIHDDFFDLGGHSLLVMQMVYQIRQTLGRDVPLSTLLQARTVAELARFLAESPFEGDSLLVPIRATGNRLPLFCIHPAGGGIIAYRDLVSGLGADLPVFCLQSKALDQPEREHSTLESMVTHYAGLITRQQPMGPYYLLGWSTGGILAMVIADSLESNGESVAFVGLLDSRPPDQDEARDDEDLLRSLAVVLGSFAGGRPVQFSADQVNQLRATLSHLPKEGHEARISSWLQSNKILPEGIPISAFESQYQLIQRHLGLLRGYRPRPIRSPIHLWLARESSQGEESAANWNHWTTSALKRTFVDGNHFTMLRPPYAIDLARLVDEQLAKADIRSDSTPEP